MKTHRDDFPWFSARRARRGDARHRKTGATTSESHGKSPYRSHPRPAGGRQEALTMHRISRLNNTGNYLFYRQTITWWDKASYGHL